MKKFWNWKDPTETAERTLFLNGTIAEESWFDDDVTPRLFKDELNSGSGDITVWINSPGGDCVAAAQIYNMLMDYKGDVTVKIDGIAASAASVIAMAGTKVLVSPVSMLMIHNPMTAAFGNSDEMQRAIEMLGSVKDSIINAYEIKTGLSRAKLSHLMDAETWMDANKAVELGFADGIMSRADETEDMAAPTVSMLYSKANVVNSLMEKIAAKCAIDPKPTVPERTGRSVDELRAMLNERISMQKVWTPLKKCFRASRMTCCSESLSPEKPMQTTLTDCTGIDAEIESLLEEIDVVTELTKRCIAENSQTAQSQEEYAARYNGFVKRYEKAKAQLEQLRTTKAAREAQAEAIGAFMFEVQELDALTDFDNKLWLTVIDTVTVHADGRMTFKFQGGTKTER